MAGATNEYIYGAVAEKIQYDPYEENQVLKSKRIARNNLKIKWKIIFNIFIAFGLCSLVMFRYAQISQLSYENNKLNKQILTVQNQNAQLSLDILEAMDLKSIRSKAEDLGMHKPDKSQIIYVNVPKSDITFVSNKKPNSNVVMNEIQNTYKKVTNLLN